MYVYVVDPNVRKYPMISLVDNSLTARAQAKEHPFGGTGISIKGGIVSFGCGRVSLNCKFPTTFDDIPVGQIGLVLRPLAGIAP